MDDNERHRLQIETGRRAAAFMRHYLRRDEEALLELATAHMRSDWDTWYFLMALAEFAARLAHELHGGAEGAERWAETLVQHFHRDS